MLRRVRQDDHEHGGAAELIEPAPMAKPLDRARRLHMPSQQDSTVDGWGVLGDSVLRSSDRPGVSQATDARDAEHEEKQSDPCGPRFGGHSPRPLRDLLPGSEDRVNDALDAMAEAVRTAPLRVIS